LFVLIMALISRYAQLGSSEQPHTRSVGSAAEELIYE